jgi:DNA-directed RNA polymerase specialized sigma24 family protein
MPSTERLEEIAAMYANHDAQLRRLVHARGARHGKLNTTVVDDACSFAWTQLLTHDYVDLGPPRWGALAWLTTAAMREAWRLHGRDYLAAPEELETVRSEREHHAPAADDVAEQHMRLDLVKQIPERPRRFLLRLALGYSYDEIGEAEGASYTTVNKQIARAKRLLRELEHTEPAGGE